MLRRLLTGVLMVVAAWSVAAGQGADAEAARRLEDEGVRAYEAGRFAEAQKLFERALELDPASENLAYFVARAAQRQFRPGVETPENRAKAEEAVRAYVRVTQSAHVGERTRQQAFEQVIYIYRALRDDERERAWLRARAEDPSAASARRSEAYVLLASKAWNCSYDITEMKVNNRVVEHDDGRLSIGYLKPKAPGDFDKALGCATDGLALAEQALALNPSSVHAWAYKTNLLRERAKLAQMDGDEVSEAEFERRAAEADAEQTRLREEERRGRAEESRVNGPVGPVSPTGSPMGGGSGERPTQQPDLTPDQLKRVIVRGGVLNGKAIYKHVPPYPREAREARVSGTVTVEIVVNENGRVTSAEAVSGHELLRETAVEAARRWVFAPTFLSGQPVKVSGTIIITFLLD